MRGKGLVWAAVLSGLVIGLDSVAEIFHLLLAINVIAWWYLARLIWHYHSTSPWWPSDVGRTTMGIKGALLLMATSGLVRRAAEQLALWGRPSSTLVYAGTLLTTVSWVAVAVAVICRYSVIRDLQARAAHEPEPPK